MEESEKRRERLRAMRVEATADVIPSSSSSQQTLTSTPLANPLLENQNSNTASTTSRFDFYTDPMAAYASNKQRPFTPRPHMSPSQCVTGPRNPGTHPSENHSQQFQNNYRPHQGMYQGGDPCYNPGPTPSPMGIRSQYPPVHQGSPNFNSAQPRPGPDYGRGNWLNNNNPSAGPGYGGSPYPAYQGSPDFRPPFPPQGRGHWPNNSPSPSSGPGHEGYPQGMGQWSNNSCSPGPGPGRGGYSQGRGQWSNNSPGPGRGGGPSPYLGRGRGQQDSNRMSPGPRYSGGRGRGRGYGDSQSRSLYNKSMVEDPWKSLTPIIWVGVKENDSRSSTSNQRFFQKTHAYQQTPSAKKPRVLNPDDAFNPKKGGSLADFLAESFDDAANV